jgi:hypothetical protein
MQLEPFPQPWQHAFRRGIAPSLSLRALHALRVALERDDARLLQGATTQPPPLQCVQHHPCEKACLVAYAGWQGEGLTTVAEVEGYFARLCQEANERLGEPAAVRFFLNHWDETDRPTARRQLLAEVDRELAERFHTAA